MSGSPVAAIIFDCFGVLYTDSKQSLLDITPDDRRQELQDIFTSNNYGYMTREEYLTAAARVAGMDVVKLQDYIAHEHHINTQLVRYIEKTLKPQYRLGLLSNIGHDWIQDFFSKHELHNLFEEVVLSGDVGITKPNPDIFSLMAKRLGLTPSQCLMIDDTEENCAGADAAGMKTLHYTSNAKLLHDLKEVEIV